MFLARAGSSLIGLGVYVVLARLLVPGELGIYFLSVSVVGCGSILASLGVNQAAVRFIAESVGRNDLERARLAIFRLLQFGVVGAFVVGLAYFPLGRLLATRVFHETLMTSSIFLMAVWIALAALQTDLSNVFRGLQQFHISALLTGPPGLVAGGTLFLSLLAFLETQRVCGFQVVVWLSMASVAVASLVGALLLVSRMPLSQTKSSSPVRWSSIAGLAWPLLGTEILLYVIAQADLWFVGASCSHQDLAVYAAAWRLAQFIAVPLSIANGVLPPFIAELYVRGNISALERLLQTVATWSGIPAVVACLIVILFGHPILRIVYGKFYSGGAIVLAILSIGQVANVLAGSCGFTLMMTGNERSMLIVTCSSGLLFILGEAAVVKPFGIFGAACVAALAMIIQNSLMLVSVKRRVGVRTHAQLSLGVF